MPEEVYEQPDKAVVSINSLLKGESKRDLTRYRWIPVSREFEPHQRPPLFP